MNLGRAVGIYLLIAVVCGPLFSAESVVTVRVGQQDSCGVAGVTKLAWDGRSRQSHLRIDVSGLPRGAAIRKALLRFWVPGLSSARPIQEEWGFGRWREPGFDGFKVWRGRAPNAQNLLDTKYPFNTPTYWLFEFEVTEAAREWAANPAPNDGLTTNFRFPAGPNRPPEVAWQRPYLQITYAGPNPSRPKQPTGLKAFYRAGQVFLTWKQIPHDGAFFDSTVRVYRHAEPITADNLDGAELLGEVHRLSQLNYRRTLTARGGDYGPWKYYVQAAGHPAYKKGESGEQRMRRVLPLIPKRFNFVIDPDAGRGWPEKIDGGRFLRKVPESDNMRIYQGPHRGQSWPGSTGGRSSRSRTAS